MEVKIRPAAKAGTWYEGDPDRLRKQIQSFLKDAKPVASNETVRALICPHAGYAYSGGTAAYGYKTVAGRKFKRVIVLAPSHMGRFEGGSILDVTHYETPLGRIALDRKACDALLTHEVFTCIPAVHDQEHSLEIQLPFLQETLSGPFDLVPILVGSLSGPQLEAMSEALLPLWDDETLVVASSDFTHYGRNFGYLPFRERIAENLEKLDMGAVEKILAMDPEGFDSYVRETGATICGRKPISVLLRMARSLGLKSTLLRYATSGEMTGDFETSVSYCAICFTGKTAGSHGFQVLDEKERATLLDLARHTVKTYVRTRKPPDDLTPFTLTDRLKQELGVFVTLKKEERLRGCIGYLKGVKPLYLAVIDNAISAASRDPRFSPVTEEEVHELSIEISVLGPVMRVRSLDEIEVGRDGLIISRGAFHRGTLLPQVPVEQGWNRTEFLENCCRKAGLPTNAYNDPETVIERYSAQVFGEEE